MIRCKLGIHGWIVQAWFGGAGLVCCRCGKKK